MTLIFRIKPSRWCSNKGCATGGASITTRCAVDISCNGQSLSLITSASRYRPMRLAANTSAASKHRLVETHTILVDGDNFLTLLWASVVKPSPIVCHDGGTKGGAVSWKRTALGKFGGRFGGGGTCWLTGSAYVLPLPVTAPASNVNVCSRRARPALGLSNSQQGSTM